MDEKFKEMDEKELELPDTVFSRDVETRVFQSIALQCLASIEGIGLLEGNLLDNLLGREGHERVKGIQVEQDQKSPSVKVKVEVNVAFGIRLPEKAQEIQQKIATAITDITGLHVGMVHVVFKNLIMKQQKEAEQLETSEATAALLEELQAEENLT